MYNKQMQQTHVVGIVCLVQVVVCPTWHQPAGAPHARFAARLPSAWLMLIAPVLRFLCSRPGPALNNRKIVPKMINFPDFPTDKSNVAAFYEQSQPRGGKSIGLPCTLPLAIPFFSPSFFHTISLSPAFLC